MCEGGGLYLVTSGPKAMASARSSSSGCLLDASAACAAHVPPRINHPEQSEGQKRATTPGN
eukprot:2632635-Pyramimonas_sp.AAC.2